MTRSPYTCSSSSRRLSWRGLRPMTQIFLVVLGLTTIIWVLRGFTVLAFLPGIVLWLLILACFATGILTTLQKMR